MARAVGQCFLEPLEARGREAGGARVHLAVPASLHSPTCRFMWRHFRGQSCSVWRGANKAGGDVGGASRSATSAPLWQRWGAASLALLRLGCVRVPTWWVASVRLRYASGITSLWALLEVTWPVSVIVFPTNVGFVGARRCVFLVLCCIRSFFGDPPPPCVDGCSHPGALSAGAGLRSCTPSPGLHPPSPRLS